MQKKKKAILVVSFGTSHNDTREKTIDVIEADIQNAYPDYAVYRAWTSKIIIKRLKARDGIVVQTVSEAMETMKQDGITEVIIQPTHVINGIENDAMKEDVMKYQNDFQYIAFGEPLLTTDEDLEKMVQIIAEEYKKQDEKEALVLMGHGSDHYANTVYAALAYRFRQKGYDHIFLGTVEAYPDMAALRQMVSEFYDSQTSIAVPLKKVHLVPFMIVAGDHAKNDLAGEHPDSWASQFREDGCEVNCTLKGLGEYPAVRQMFLNHIALCCQNK